jgi:hypothetical protein
MSWQASSEAASATTWMYCLRRQASRSRARTASLAGALAGIEPATSLRNSCADRRKTIAAGSSGFFICRPAWQSDAPRNDSQPPPFVLWATG